MKKLLCLILVLFALTLAVSSVSLPVMGIPLVTPVPTNVDAVELVSNSHFEVEGDWFLSKGIGQRVCSSECQYRFSAVLGGSRLVQKLSGGLAGERLVLSAYSRGKDWKHSSYVHLKIVYADGSVSGIYMALNRGYSMLRNEGQIVTTADYSKLKLTVVAGSLSGKLWVDEISVTKNTP